MTAGLLATRAGLVLCLLLLALLALAALNEMLANGTNLVCLFDELPSAPCRFGLHVGGCHLGGLGRDQSFDVGLGCAPVQTTEVEKQTRYSRRLKRGIGVYAYTHTTDDQAPNVGGHVLAIATHVWLGLSLQTAD